jgi:hypothetical protein
MGRLEQALGILLILVEWARASTLARHFGTDPTVAAAVSELKQLGYVTVPDSGR